MSKVAQSKHSTSVKAEKVNMTGFLKVGELREAQNEILKYVQRRVSRRDEHEILFSEW